MGYYNLLDPQVQIAQAELAKAYGIEGFCYWHYWFNGRRLLERPLEQVLESGRPEFPFCLAWANESWTRAWDGRSDEVLLEQEYGGEEDDKAHFQYLVRAFMDRRYIRINGKPLFLIYRPADLPNPEHTASLWKKLARKSGLEGLYLVAIRTSFDSTPENHWLNYGFDAELYFHPDFKAIWDQFGAGKLTGTELDVSGGEPGLVVAYQDAWHVMANSGHGCYRTVVPCWDNSPRKRSPFILAESSPEEYQKWLNIEVERVLHRSPDQRIVFINAWNEWGEGNHLEPDTRFGRGYLEATRRAVVSANVSILREEGKLKEAIANLEKLVSADPEYAQGYNDLGVLLYESGDLERAIQCLQRAAELD
ncbi:MAG: glycoside hydrolase family 99-like domain-containing protein, partial [Armatimonadota bacterium]